MFAPGALARRIEAAEASLTFEIASGVRARRPERDLLLERLGGGVGCYFGGSPFDKVIGLGFAPLEEDRLAAFESAVRDRGGTVQAEVSTLADPGVARALTQRGYALAGFENVLGLRLDEPTAARLENGLDGSTVVAPVPPGDIDVWISVVAEGFAHPDVFDGPASHESFPREAIEQVMRDVGSLLHRFLARRNGTIAGGGSMRLHDGIAQLAGAATLPAHRRRGVQTALLRSRLLFAARAGCDLAVVTTQPGSVSQQNVMREGFSLLYARAILQRPPDRTLDRT